MISWQTLFAQSITHPAELLKILDLDPALAVDLPAFPLRVPRGFVARMQKGNIHDPLLRQVLPLAQEWVFTPGFEQDPLQERLVNPMPGLLHKYHGRVLLMLSTMCGVNCRYCFRREFPYSDNRLTLAALDYLRENPSIREVILSGGDPLVISDRRLGLWVQTLADIPHVKTLRIHSRMPIVLPERLTMGLKQILSNTRLRVVLVLHTNHPQEVDDHVAVAINRIRDARFTLLNQSVLLKGINDSVDTLVDLSERLFDMGILPYYLHLLDKVGGTAHLEVAESTAKKLIQEVQKRLPGYLVPQLVREIPGRSSKTRL